MRPKKIQGGGQHTRSPYGSKMRQKGITNKNKKGEEEERRVGYSEERREIDRERERRGEEKGREGERERWVESVKARLYAGCVCRVALVRSSGGSDYLNVLDELNG